MRSTIIALTFVAGCASPPADGALTCDTDPAGRCPTNFHCADDGRCYRDGHDPDLAMASGDDMGTVEGNDLSGIPSPDLWTPPADLSQLPADLSGPFTWTAATGITGNLRAGFALQRNNVYVVGDGNLVLHSSGDGTWSAPINTGISGGTWNAIWGDRATGDLWLCGSNGTPSAIIVHTKDGTTWNTETQSTSLGSACLAIWGSSSTDVYASGNGANGLLVHSTGTGVWGTAIGGLQPLPSPAHYWLGIGGSSSSNVVFVGGPDIYRYTGSGGINREFQNASTTVVNYSVAAVSTVDLYVGTDHGVYYSKGNGTWTGQMTTATLTRVWGSGPTDIYAANGGCNHSIGDGTWTAITTGVMYVNTVFGFDQDDVYFIGNNAITHGHR
jgi:hypothetical protein